MKFFVGVHPYNYHPVGEEEAAMIRDIDDLNDEMVAAGIRFFGDGLEHITSSKSLTLQPDGDVLISDGPYIETKEYLGGFWILELPNMDEALQWGRRAAVACRVPVEVRPFMRRSPD